MSDMLFGIVLDAPSPSQPSYWVGKAKGDGPGWLISPSKVGRLKIPEHDAKRIVERLPLVAQLKVERGWIASVVKIGRRSRPAGARRRRKTFTSKSWPGEQAEAPAPEAPAQANTPLELLQQVNDLRLRAAELCGTADVDSPEGYWLGDMQSTLARLVNQGTQLLKGSDAPE